jgi:hypothetical protein
MANLLRETRTIVEIWWEPEGQLKVGEYGVKSIVVECENGQMGEVPWFCIEYEDGDTCKHNAAFVSGIKYGPQRGETE